MTKQISYAMELYEYETWGNPEDGFEVNNVFRTIDDMIYIGDENTTCKELVKAFHNAPIWNMFGSSSIKIDFRSIDIIDSWPFIEIEDKQGKPLGRVEIVKEIGA